MLNNNNKQHQYSSSSSSISSISSSSNYYNSAGGGAGQIVTNTQSLTRNGQPIDIYARNIHSISPSPQIQPHPTNQLTGSYHSVSDLSVLSSSDAEGDDHHQQHPHRHTHHHANMYSRRVVNSKRYEEDDEEDENKKQMLPLPPRNRMLSNSENFEFVKPRDPCMLLSPLSNSYDHQQVR